MGFRSGNTTWEAQREDIRNFSELDRSMYSTSKRLFFVLTYQLLTLDDDVMENRSAENPVRMLSNRKAAKEGQTSDVVADAPLSLTLD